MCVFSLIAICIIIFSSAIIIIIDFLGFLLNNDRFINKIVFRIAEVWSVIVLPYFYMFQFDKNDCCEDTAAFSPDHVLSLFVVVVLCQCVYFYSSYRQKIATPLLEVVINAMLLLGFILNCVVAQHVNEIVQISAGNLPVTLLFIMALTKNQRLFIDQTKNFVVQNGSEELGIAILNLKPLLRYPILFVICIPILFIIISLLLLVGQKPDSMIRAFTDTYRHKLSQLDYECLTVNCPDGHYLCTVAAKGHQSIVKPQRMGERNGKAIVCNRQLLVSNAFEDLIQEKTPFIHKVIRTQYDKVGDFVYRYYDVFNIKIVSDAVYILMKPLEWFFLIVLYTFDKKPENRIAMQYIKKEDRESINSLLSEL